jgi:hypothetical protein
MADDKPKGEGEGGQKPPASSAQGGAPAPQEKPWWEARGFKSEAEAVESMDNSQRTLTKISEENRTLERSLNVMMATRDAGAGAGNGNNNAPGYRRYYEGLDVDEAFSNSPQKLTEVYLTATDRLVKDRVHQILAQDQEVRETREAFYKSNPELSDHKDLVKFYASELGRENPSMTVSEAMVEVAKRVRKRVSDIKGGNAQGNPGGGGKPPKEPLPHTGAGGEGGGEGRKEDPPKTEGESNPVLDAIKDRLDAREKKTGLLR